MKIVTIVGARPQFIKAAAVSRVIRKEHQEILVHTGQHYDNNMSDIFFDELSIPRPDYHLGVGSGTHARQTAAMLVGIEKVLHEEKPDGLLVYGDTNSTLAGALAAAKIHIPVIHVEAGLRSFNMLMPEEINRILTDRISKLLLCPTWTAVNNLKSEGRTERVHLVGDVMCDAVIYYSKLIEKKDKSLYIERLAKLFPASDPEKWYLATIHRAENTDTGEKIKEILDAFESLDYPVIFPVHPRSRRIVDELVEKYHYRNTVFIQPVGYIDMLFFAKNAVKIITDSGGLQKEAYILETPCVTVRDQTEWVETLKGNHNILCKPNKQEIIDKVMNTKIDEAPREHYYGQGDAAIKINNILDGGF